MVSVRNEAICNRITERHERERYEGWNCVANVAPVNARHLAHHHAANLPNLVCIQRPAV